MTVRPVWAANGSAMDGKAGGDRRVEMGHGWQASCAHSSTTGGYGVGIGDWGLGIGIRSSSVPPVSSALIRKDALTLVGKHDCPDARDAGEVVAHVYCRLESKHAAG